MNASLTSTDRDFFTQLVGCPGDFIANSVEHLEMLEEDWNEWGFSDPCNYQRPFGKNWESDYLIRKVLVYYPGRSYHAGLEDYGHLVSSGSDNWHAEMRFLTNPWHDDEYVAQFGERFGRVNLVREACGIFDDPRLNWSDLAERTSILVHEAWHAWQAGEGEIRDHYSNCTDGAGSCDYARWHRPALFAPGMMNAKDDENFILADRKFHYPNQAQVEFLCDLATTAEGPVENPVTAALYEEAAAFAAYVGNNRIVYSVSTPRCWSPRPF